MGRRKLYIDLIVLFTFLTVITGALVYKVQYDIKKLEDEISVLDKKIKKNKYALKVLNAEWNYLTTPNKIEKLVKKHLTDYKKISSKDIISIYNIPIKEKYKEKIK